MKSFKGFLPLFGVLMLILACSFFTQVESTPLPPVPPAEPSIPSTATFTLIPTASAVPPTAVPTFIPIRPDTVANLTSFQTFRMGDTVRALAFSPDGNTLAAAGGNSGDYDIHIWDVGRAKLVNVLTGHKNIVWDLAFSPDGSYLVSVSSDLTAQIRDWPGTEIVKTLDFKGEMVRTRFSPDGKTLALGGVDTTTRGAAVWTYAVGTWEPELSFPEFLNITALAYSPDGKVLVGGGTSRNVQVWNASTGAKLFTLSHAHQVTNSAISPDGLTVATATCKTIGNAGCKEGEIWLWDLSNGRLLRKLAGFTGGVNNGVSSVAFTPDGLFLFAGSSDGTLRAYSTTDYKLAFESYLSGGIEALVVSRDGALLATGGSSGDVTLWKVIPPP